MSRQGTHGGEAEVVGGAVNGAVVMAWVNRSAVHRHAVEVLPLVQAVAVSIEDLALGIGRESRDDVDLMPACLETARNDSRVPRGAAFWLEPVGRHQRLQCHAITVACRSRGLRR